MITYTQAKQCLSDLRCNVSTESVSVIEAVGRISAKDLLAPNQIPSFHNSAMDGYALRLKQGDILHAGTMLPVKETIYAGVDITGHSKQSEQAFKIMTGAPLPQGFNTVVKLEDTSFSIQSGQGFITIKTDCHFHQNVRLAGEDFEKNDSLLEKGTLIGPSHIMALLAQGINEILVYRKPKCIILCTGDEIVDDPALPLKPGQIRNSNGQYIASILNQSGCEAYYFGKIKDNEDTFIAAVDDILSKEAPDFIITCGAVSMGDKDFIPSGLARMKSHTYFHKVGIRPGKPILLAQLPKTHSYFWGLPGNPIAAAVGLRFFILPMIRTCFQLGEEVWLHGFLKRRFYKKNTLKQFCKAYQSINSDGQCIIDILDGQESFKIKPLLQANCWAILNESEGTLEPGSMIQYAPFIPSYEKTKE